MTFAAGTPTALAALGSLNDTGMTQCVDADHAKKWMTKCGRSMQDAKYGRDVSDPNPDDGAVGFSFRKMCRSGEMAGEGSCPADPLIGVGPNDWGCVYDNVTQLTWEMKTSDGGTHDGKRQFTHLRGHNGDQDTDVDWLVDKTNAEALCGATGWRLPDVQELQSIVHYGMGQPGHSRLFLDSSFFPNSMGSNTWTGVVSYNRHRAYSVDFGDGSAERKKRYENATARLVNDAPRSSRGGTFNAQKRFSLSKDGGEVTDTLTGLVWRRCEEGFTWNPDLQACKEAGIWFTFPSALKYAAEHRDGGWRIPNVKELISIFDHASYPVLDEYYFPTDDVYMSFVSSTTSVYENRGFEGDDYEGAYVHVVPIRDGSSHPTRAFVGVPFLLRMVKDSKD